MWCRKCEKKIYIFKIIGLFYCNYNFIDNKDCFFFWVYCFVVSCVYFFRFGVGRFLVDRYWFKIELDFKVVLSLGFIIVEVIMSLYYKV